MSLLRIFHLGLMTPPSRSGFCRQVIALLGFLCFLRFAVAQTALPPSERMVVLITLDGFPAYALDDPKLPVPTLRALSRRGAYARRMGTVNPTVTWPNHTTLATGVLPSEHGLLYNGTAVRTGSWPPVKIDYSIDKERMVHAMTVYDLAHGAGLKTAQVDWVAINHAPTIDWEFPELATANDPLVKEMIAKGVISEADAEDFRRANIVWRDEIWCRAAEFLIREHKPNLLLVHFLTLDSTHHRYGPNSLASQDAMGFLDGLVARVLAAIHAAGLQDRTTILIASDHGFKQVHKEIRPLIALRAAGLEHSVFVLSEGGSAMLYLDKNRLDELTRRVRSMFTGTEGIERVAGPDEFQALGLPDPAKDSQAPDLVLYAKTDYAFSNPRAGDTGPAIVTTGQATGAHGYLASDPDMDAIFIASGYGIRAGASVEEIQNIDVAPTIAKLLDVRLPKARGKSLDWALTQP